MHEGKFFDSYLDRKIEKAIRAEARKALQEGMISDLKVAALHEIRRAVAPTIEHELREAITGMLTRVSEIEATVRQLEGKAEWLKSLLIRAKERGAVA